MASSSTDCEEKSMDSSTDVSTSDATPPPPPPPPPEEEPQGRRKSSRLKAKMTRQSQEAESSEEAGDAYNLRLSSLVKRVQTERRQTAPRQPKGKSKPPPLSKYRRRTANARERMRMKEINEGFERLREALPEMEQESNAGKKKEKPTKLTVLNLALNYIHALRDILGYPAVSEDGGSGGSTSGQNEESDLGSDAASTRTLSTSSGSCDEICSNPSPESSVLDMKEFSLSDTPSFISSAMPKDLTTCPHPAPSASLMDFRREVRSSPSSSDLSLPPTPPPLPLPEECMDIDQSDLLDVSISLAEWEDIEDIIL